LANAVRISISLSWLIDKIAMGKKPPSPSDNFIAKKCYFTVSLFGLGANTTLGVWCVVFSYAGTCG